ncbi:palmitoyl-protein thioesterase [Coemansia reversa NRRL 1564]|uniref:Palmitoyl-protein thioesterase 1 n=1 Tax=Coemansia reversa (strain ATCC 12441 / NRRL 1564) TaxID=763665 RepID=A0A2G5BG55_COERN|nr:palmitoyl-protein thioesterase [Coemansia reversa NRRL 1564]|eukprot:PIA18004.1 palmitoyl-protein thioesterase [Coemansia reversa NRRL 1564]
MHLRISTFLLLMFLSVSSEPFMLGSPLPVIVWHGMGDTCCDNSTMGEIVRLIKDEIPGVFVHSVQIGDTESADRNAGFFGNLNNQIDRVCTELEAIPELQHGANLMGFSQGGLFLRALVQRCPTIKAKSLVTFGSPHSGVAEIPKCPNDGDALCGWMRQLASRGVYSWYIRDHVVQAQYFKDPKRLDQYLRHNIFLPDINGDLDERNTNYRSRIIALEKLVLVRFSEDNMIYPSQSSWFGFIDDEGNEIPLQNTTMYHDDWLGLRELDEDSRLEFVNVDGKHMEIGEKSLRRIVAKHFGGGIRGSVFRVQDY